MDSVDISGLMDAIIRVNGKIMRCMELVYLHGPIKNHILVNFKIIKKMVMEYIILEMVKCIKAIGKIVEEMD